MHKYKEIKRLIIVVKKTLIEIQMFNNRGKSIMCIIIALARVEACKRIIDAAKECCEA